MLTRQIPCSLFHRPAQAIDNAGACVGVLAKDGIVIASEKKAVSKLLAKSKRSEKIYTIDAHVVCAVAGLTSDANVLVEFMRVQAQQYRFQYGGPIPVEQLVQRICDEKQYLTQMGGMRPYARHAKCHPQQQQQQQQMRALF